MDRPASPGQASTAESIFAGWLAKRDEDFDALVRANKQHEPELRELHAIWMRIEPLLRLAEIDAASAEALGPATDELVRRLSQHAPKTPRYKLEGSWRAAGWARS